MLTPQKGDACKGNTRTPVGCFNTKKWLKESKRSKRVLANFGNEVDFWWFLIMLRTRRLHCRQAMPLFSCGSRPWQFLSLRQLGWAGFWCILELKWLWFKINPYGYGSIPMKIPFLGGWTSIYQLFWGSLGVQGFDTLPYYWPCCFFSQGDLN